MKTDPLAIERAKAYIERTREEFSRQVALAIAQLPDGWVGGVLAGPLKQTNEDTEKNNENEIVPATE